MDRRASLSPSLHVRAWRARTHRRVRVSPCVKSMSARLLLDLHTMSAPSGEERMQRMCIRADRTRCAMLPPLEIEMRTAGCRVGAPLKQRCQKPHGRALAGAFVLRHTLGRNTRRNFRCRPGACRQSTQIQPLIRPP